jgi:hypothetical protein
LSFKGVPRYPASSHEIPGRLSLNARATRDDLVRRTDARFEPEQIVRFAQALPD